MFYLYIIYSDSVDKYYVGHSSDPLRRLSEHNNNPQMTFTHKYRPWVIKGYFPISEKRGDALRVERYIKKLKSRKIIEQLIHLQNIDDFINQSVRVPTCRD